MPDRDLQEYKVEELEKKVTKNVTVIEDMTKEVNRLKHKVSELEEDGKDNDDMLDDLLKVVNKLASDSKVEFGKIKTKIAIFTAIFSTFLAITLEVAFQKFFN